MAPAAGGDAKSPAPTQSVCVWPWTTVDVSPTPSHPGVVGFMDVEEPEPLLVLEHAEQRMGVSASVTLARVRNSRRFSMVRNLRSRRAAAA